MNTLRVAFISIWLFLPGYLAAITISEKGLNVELPLQWVEIKQPPTFLVQQRAKSPTGEQFVSIGCVLTPGLSLSDFAALGLLGLEKIPEGADSIAKEAGISTGDLEKVWTALAGKQNWKQITEQNRLASLKPTKFERQVISGREAYLVCSEMVYEGKPVMTKQWIIKGYSPGEFMLVTAAALSTNDLETIPLPANIKISDTRTEENRFKSFRLKLPAGAVSTKFAKQEENTTGSFKYPIGLLGNGLLTITESEFPNDPKEFFEYTCSRIKKKCKTFREVDSSVDELRGILFGKIEMNYELLDSPIGARTTSGIICIAKEKNGKRGLIFTFIYPPDIAQAIRAMVSGILDGVSLQRN